MSNLQSKIETLVHEFSASLIKALRTASIDELSGSAGATPRPRVGRPPASASASAPAAAPAAKSTGKGGRLGRRSTADLARMVDDIVSLLEKHPEGLRAEDIRSSLNCSAKELPRPMADALSSGRISKTGEKRATTYFAGGDAGGKGKGRGAGKKR